MATDNGNPQLSNEDQTYVRVNIEDGTDSMPPTWELYEGSPIDDTVITIAENAPTGFVVGTFETTHSDPTATITYGIITSGEYFRIATQEGDSFDLVVIGGLDYTAQQEHIVKIRATVCCSSLLNRPIARKYNP